MHRLDPEFCRSLIQLDLFFHHKKQTREHPQQFTFNTSYLLSSRRAQTIITIKQPPISLLSPDKRHIKSTQSKDGGSGSLFRRRRFDVAPLASVCKSLVPFSVIAKLTVSKTYIGGLDLNCLTPRRMPPSNFSLRRQHPCSFLLSSVARTSSHHHTARPTTQRRPSSTTSTKPDTSRSSWRIPFVALPSWTSAEFRISWYYGSIMVCR